MNESKSVHNVKRLVGLMNIIKKNPNTESASDFSDYSKLKSNMNESRKESRRKKSRKSSRKKEG